ncbi:hypothetical protein JOC77_000393 [Peribacillus deserti]|uniref:Uncharacterized protein n=1 Tax=Peribacillus deserti TaxID=673318 RepID=A0ABS2QD93_9BACI|nr:hypothetical protein [Peribacillus deserti]MBM7690990.1 hypothetical protein [Peribacillus deserti]
MKRIQFEHVFAFVIMSVLAASLYLFRENSEISYLIVGVLANSLGAISAFYFTKHDPRKKQ